MERRNERSCPRRRALGPPERLLVERCGLPRDGRLERERAHCITLLAEALSHPPRAQTNQRPRPRPRWRLSAPTSRRLIRTVELFNRRDSNCRHLRVSIRRGRRSRCGYFALIFCPAWTCRRAARSRLHLPRLRHAGSQGAPPRPAPAVRGVSTQPMPA